MVEHDPRCSVANPMFEEVDQPGIGTYLMPGSPLRFGAGEPRGRAPARRCSASTPTRSSRTSSGSTDAEIGRLHADRVVAGLG